MGAPLFMGGNNIPKIHTISVEEIIQFKKKKYQEDQKQAEALKELRYYLKEACCKNAYKMGDLVKIIRNFNSPPISNNLKTYIASTPNRKLKEKIDGFIIKSHGGEYSTFELHPGWNFTCRWSNFLYRKFYFYKDENFVNIYRLSETDLLLYMNHTWINKDEEELYMDRMRNIAGEK
jgi:hypothetical protein